METVFGTIELCKLIAVTGRRLYDTSKDIGNNFQTQTLSLGEQVKELSERVEEHCTKVKEHQGRGQGSDLEGLENVLNEIKDVFDQIDTFFKKLQRINKNIVKYLAKRIWSYFNITNGFEAFNRILKDLEERLDTKLKDYSFHLDVDIYAGVSNLKKEIRNQDNDLKHILEEFKDKSDGEHQNIVQYLKQIDATQQKKICKYDKEGCALALQVERSNLTNIEWLCDGTFCYYNTAQLDLEKVVMKCIKDVNNEDVKLSFEKETRNLMMFSSGHITRVLGMCNKEDDKFFILEYMQRGSLSKVVHQGDQLSLRVKVKLARSAAMAVYRCHSRLIHTSLRSDKFLVDEHYQAKLSGMGHAKTFSSCKHLQSSEQPLVDINFYRAPERFAPAKLTKEADIYEFGIVLWEIFTQTKPFSTLAAELGREPNKSDVMRFVSDAREEYDLKDYLPDDYAVKGISDVIRMCRSVKPSERPKVTDILNALQHVLGDPDSPSGPELETLV